MVSIINFLGVVMHLLLNLFQHPKIGLIFDLKKHIVVDLWTSGKWVVVERLNVQKHGEAVGKKPGQGII